MTVYYREEVRTADMSSVITVATKKIKSLNYCLFDQTYDTWQFPKIIPDSVAFLLYASNMEWGLVQQILRREVHILSH